MADGFDPHATIISDHTSSWLPRDLCRLRLFASWGKPRRESLTAAASLRRLEGQWAAICWAILRTFQKQIINPLLQAEQFIRDETIETKKVENKGSNILTVPFDLWINQWTTYHHVPQHREGLLFASHEGLPQKTAKIEVSLQPTRPWNPNSKQSRNRKALGKKGFEGRKWTFKSPRCPWTWHRTSCWV